MFFGIHFGFTWGVVLGRGKIWCLIAGAGEGVALVCGAQGVVWGRSVSVAHDRSH